MRRMAIASKSRRAAPERAASRLRGDQLDRVATDAFEGGERLLERCHGDDLDVVAHHVAGERPDAVDPVLTLIGGHQE